MEFPCSRRFVVPAHGRCAWPWSPCWVWRWRCPPHRASGGQAAETAAAQQAQQLPEPFEWSSSGPLVAPKPDAAHDVVSVKDPSVFWYDGRWHVYMTTPDTSGSWELSYTSFADWSQAADAPQTFLDTNPNIGDRYAAAPQAFYFEPDDTWYLVFQSPNPTYYTTKNPSDPMSWEGPGYFMESEPPILQENKGDGTWLDFWVICDDATCHLFFSDGNGHIYRASTSVDQFPNGFGNTEIALSDPDSDRLFEGGNVYRVGDTGQYLLLEEAMATGSDWRRYLRAWTSDSLDGEWTTLADTEANPFLRHNNVTFADGQTAWTQDFSHGELIRDGYDQTLTIDPCNLQFLYQGLDPDATGDYSRRAATPIRRPQLQQPHKPPASERK